MSRRWPYLGIVIVLAALLAAIDAAGAPRWLSVGTGVFLTTICLVGYVTRNEPMPDDDFWDEHGHYDDDV